MSRHIHAHHSSLETPGTSSASPRTKSSGRRSRRLAPRFSLVAALALVGLAAGCDEANAQGSGDPELEEILLRLDTLESKEQIRTTLLTFSAIVDSSDPARLSEVVPYVTEDFTLDAIDYTGEVFHFEGPDGLLNEYGPIMKDAQANLTVSAINVDLDLEGDTARATFKFSNSVKPPPQLNLGLDVKVLLFTANTATFRREDGTWKVASLELLHSLAYPGSIAP